MTGMPYQYNILPRNKIIKVRKKINSLTIINESRIKPILIKIKLFKGRFKI